MNISSGTLFRNPARLGIKCCDGNTIIIHAPERTKIETRCADGSEKDKPRLVVGSYQNQDVIIFKGGSRAIELPYSILSKEYVSLVLGMKRPAGQRKQGYLKATQRKTNGKLSAGYTIEG